MAHWSPWAAWVAGHGLRAQPAGDQPGGSAQRRDPARWRRCPGCCCPIVLTLTGPARDPRRAAAVLGGRLHVHRSRQRHGDGGALPLVVRDHRLGHPAQAGPVAPARLVVRADPAGHLGLVGGLAAEAQLLLAAVLRLRRGRQRSPPGRPATPRRCAAPRTGSSTSPPAATRPGRPASSSPTTPWLVLASGLLAAVGVIGLVTLAQCLAHARWCCRCRLGMVCLTVGHAVPGGSPLAVDRADLLDGLLALLRNVPRSTRCSGCPLALGVGAAFARSRRSGCGPAARSRRRRARVAGGRRAAVVGARPSSHGPAGDRAQPAHARAGTRCPTTGTRRRTTWRARPGRPAPGSSPAPGSGCRPGAGPWTSRCPRSPRHPWVTRSQVPLVPPETIRVLSRLEEFLASGAGSANLGRDAGPPRDQPRRRPARPRPDAGRGHLHQPGVDRDGPLRGRRPARPTFGATGLRAGHRDLLGRRRPTGRTPLSVAQERRRDAWPEPRPTSSTRSARASWPRTRRRSSRATPAGTVPADVVGDAYRLRERNFGRVHDAEGADARAGRAAAQRPDRAATTPATRARSRWSPATTGIDYVDASSSMAYTDGLGEVRPERRAVRRGRRRPRRRRGAPASSRTRSGQWLDDPLRRSRSETRRGQAPVHGLQPGRRRGRPVARRGRRRDRARSTVDPFTGEAEVDLSGRAQRPHPAHRGRRQRGARRARRSPSRTSTSPGRRPTRTLVVPDAEAARDAATCSPRGPRCAPASPR